MHSRAVATAEAQGEIDKAIADYTNQSIELSDQSPLVIAKSWNLRAKAVSVKPFE